MKHTPSVVIRPNKSKIELCLVFDFYYGKKVLYDDAEPNFKNKNDEARANQTSKWTRSSENFFISSRPLSEKQPRNAIVVFYRYSFCLCLCVIFTLNVHLNLENVLNTVTKFTNEVFLLSKWMWKPSSSATVCVFDLRLFTVSILPHTFQRNEHDFCLVLFLLCATYHFHFISYNWIIIILFLLLLLLQHVRFSQNSCILFVSLRHPH